jgi:Radical SAM superfamily
MACAVDFFIYNIEIVGACNLKCPSCPVGNVRISELGQPRPKGFMALDHFRRILEKIRAEHPVAPNTLVRLFNWGEPILHPQIGEFIAAIHTVGFRSSISTNLNNVKNLEAVVQACPSEFIISLSGYQQEVYSQTHEGGDIETVKRNMCALRNLREKHGRSFMVAVAYHAYRHNCGSDFTNMRALCQQLGFHFHAYWAWFSPLEKLLKYLDGDELPGDQALLRMLIVDPREHVQIVKRNAPRNSDCVLRSNAVNIGVDGSVELCCAAFDPSSTVAPDFLKISHKEMQARRYRSPLCGPCMEKRVHQLYNQVGYEELTAIGNRLLADRGVENQVSPTLANCPICYPGASETSSATDSHSAHLQVVVQPEG